MSRPVGEAERIRLLWLAGKTDDEIGDALGVSRTAACKRRHRLGLVCNTDPNGKTHDRARAENEEPWQPLPGMTKRRCTECEFWFAAAPDKRQCPDCLERMRTGRTRSRARAWG
jgi:hypothetical protein